MQRRTLILTTTLLASLAWLAGCEDDRRQLFPRPTRDTEPRRQTPTTSSEPPQIAARPTDTMTTTDDPPSAAPEPEPTRTETPTSTPVVEPEPAPPPIAAPPPVQPEPEPEPQPAPRAADEPRTPVASARVAIRTGFNGGLNAFRRDCGDYPVDLILLREAPADPQMRQRWKGPYLDANGMLDPWGNPWFYEYPSMNSPSTYDLGSSGPDGIFGTPDDLNR